MSCKGTLVRLFRVFGKKRTNRIPISETPDLLGEISRPNMPLCNTLKIYGISSENFFLSTLLELQAEDDAVNFDQENSCRPLIPTTIGASVHVNLHATSTQMLTLAPQPQNSANVWTKVLHASYHAKSPQPILFKGSTPINGGRLPRCYTPFQHT